MKNLFKTGVVAVGALALSLFGFAQVFGYGGSGGQVIVQQPIVAPVGGFTATVNGGAVATATRVVTLTLNGGSAVRMAISNNPNFDNAPQEAYSATKQWTLSEGAGLKTVYIKFFDVNGNATQTLTATILSTSTEVGTPTVNAGQVLGVKISAVDELITATKPGTRSAKVAELQTALRAAGFFPAGLGSTGFYGSITAEAVKKYQASLETKQVLGTKIASIESLVSTTKFGTRSAAVKDLQDALKAAGYFPAGTQSTGFYGTVTRAAVNKYIVATR